MFKSWINGLVCLIGLLFLLDMFLYQEYTVSQAALEETGFEVLLDDGDIIYLNSDNKITERRDKSQSNLQLAVIATLGVLSLLAISLIARSIKQGRLAVLKPYFEGMDFFKWAIRIVGAVIAIALLRL